MRGTRTSVRVRSERDRNNQILVFRLSMSGAVIGVVFGFAAVALGGLIVRGTALMGCGLALAAAPLVLRRTGNLRLVGDLFACAVIVGICIVGPLRGALPLVALAFGLTVPPIALFLGGMQRGLAWTAVLLIVYATALALGLSHDLAQYAAAGVSEHAWMVIEIVGLSALLVLMLLLARWYELARARDEAARFEAEKRLLHAQKMESVGNLAGGIAHDFNNVLGVILAISETAAEDASPGSQLAEDLGQIREAAMRANELTHQLLSLARRQPEDDDIVGDPTAAAHSVRTMLERALPRHIELVMTVESRLPLVCASEGAMSQALLNLAINARDAMPEGGRLEVAMERVEVGRPEGAARELEPGTYVRLRVSDTGEGIPADIRDRIFEPFFTTKDERGSGLGLAMVYALAQRAHGAVEIDSEPARGTTFTLFFRRASSAGTTVDNVAVPDRAPAHTIMVVEDDTPVRRATCRLLEDSGYRVCEVANGHDALEQLDAGDAVDMVITDIVMPGMNGRELANRIGARGLAVPVLFISGFSDPKIGPIPEDQLLRKPFGRQDLIDRVERCIAGGQSMSRSAISGR